MARGGSGLDPRDAESGSARSDPRLDTPASCPAGKDRSVPSRRDAPCPRLSEILALRRAVPRAGALPRERGGQHGGDHLRRDRARDDGRAGRFGARRRVVRAAGARAAGAGDRRVRGDRQLGGAGLWPDAGEWQPHADRGGGRRLQRLRRPDQPLPGARGRSVADPRARLAARVRAALGGSALLPRRCRGGLVSPCRLPRRRGWRPRLDVARPDASAHEPTSSLRSRRSATGPRGASAHEPGSAPPILSASARAPRRGSRRSRGRSCARASPPRRTSSGAGRGGTWCPRARHAARS